MIEENAPATYAGEAKALSARRPDTTLRQNLENQIVQAEKHLKALQEAKERLEKTGILDSRIEDIHQAMRW